MYRRGLTLKKLFSVFFFSCARLEEGRESPRVPGKILLFSQVVLYHKFRKNLAISATVVGRSSSTRREEERVGCHPCTKVRVPHRVELYGPLALCALVAARYPRIVAVYTKYNPRQGKAVVI